MDGVALLKIHPMFSAWPESKLSQLALKFFEKKYQPEETLVIEGDVVDNLLFIVEGIAEVWVADPADKRKKTVVSTLRRGETIGLREGGLYSSTGFRTATITAFTEVTVFGIKLDDLHDFLRENPDVESELEKVAQHIWKMRMVKEAAPFAVLSTEQIQALADEVEEVDVAAQTLLFNEGDKGDCCYLIASGEVEIIRNNELVATLEKSALFGETALLMDLPRNASARTKTACQLLRLNREDLLNIISEVKVAAKLFSTLEQERSRPIRAKNIIEHQNTANDGQIIITLKNPEQHEYFQLTKEGWFIWQQMDGKKSVKQIILAFSEEFGIFSPPLVIGLVASLAHAGFVEVYGYRYSSDMHLPFWMRVVDKIRSVMEWEFPFSNADKWISKTYQSFAKIFFTVPLMFLMLVMSVGGMISFGILTVDMVSHLEQAQHVLLLIILIDLVGVIFIPLHELAHAYTTKHFGREVHHFGIGWYWFGPMAFTDTSDMWLSSKWPRIAVNLAGMFVDTVLACITTFLAFILSGQYAVFFWLSSLFFYLSVLRNLYPLIELDGYYTLMDLFDHPNLREDAIEWLIEASPKFTRDYKDEILYWIICIIFFFAWPFVTWFVQALVLVHIFPILGHGLWRFLLPIAAVMLALLSVWVQIKKQRQLEEED